MTLIELLEAIAAITLGALLAEMVSRPFHGFWHTVVLWSVGIVGSGVIFLLFLYGLGYLLHYLRRRKELKRPNGKVNSN